LSDSAPSIPPLGRTGRLLGRLFVPVGCLVIAVAIVSVPLPVFIEQPREPVPLAASITVDSPRAGGIEGDYLLTAVTLRRATPGDLVASWTRDDVALVPAASIIPSGTVDSAFFDEQREVFADTAEVAAAVGLEGAGYEALSGDGVGVVDVVPDSPADGQLQPGDVIVEVDGRDIGTAADLVDSITSTPEGDERELTVERGEERVDVALTPRPISAETPQIGVQTQTVGLDIDLPFPVQVDAGRIGGPSAGLLVALTVYDRVDPVDLAAGRLIAGTGTMEVSGAVGAIGGVVPKVVSAAQIDADVFLVPASQVDEARAAVPPGSDLQVIGVSTFEEAVAALRGTPTAR
jgi:Lon-like protease